MTRCLAPTLALLCLVGFACEKNENEQENTQKNERTGKRELMWVHKEDALKTAAENGKPALLDISAAWCQPCVDYDDVTFADPSVVKALKGWALVRLDVTRQMDRHKDLQERYQAKTLPTLILFDRSGNEIHRITKFLNAAEFKAELASLSIPAK